MRLEFAGAAARAKARFTVADSIDVAAFPELLNVFAKAAGLAIDVDFTATRLNSSHVVLEDTGLVIGMGLFEMLKARMMASGVNAAGSSIRSRAEFDNDMVSASVSCEGRKFLKIVPAASQDEFRWKHSLGGSAFGGIRTEDIDDFLDALAGGMHASILIHERKACPTPEVFWSSAIAAVGRAIAEAFEPNPQRKGLPPGVKATLL